MAALSRGSYINFVSFILQKVAAGLINEVAALTKTKSMKWYGKYVLDFPDLATIMRWPLSEVSLYDGITASYLLFCLDLYFINNKSS